MDFHTEMAETASKSNLRALKASFHSTFGRMAHAPAKPVAPPMALPISRPAPPPTVAKMGIERPRVKSAGRTPTAAPKWLNAS